MTYRLHHIHLLVNDLERMIGFFTQELGARLIARKKFQNADGASFDLGGEIINLRVARDVETVSKEKPVLQLGLHHLGLVVEDLEKAYADLSAKGYEFTTKPTNTGTNLIAFFKGPENTVFELLQPLT